MKILIAGDIHGSAYYCEKLVNMFKTLEADTLLLTGDILYHGPRNSLPKDYLPSRVAELLNPLADKVIAVRGNCEAEVDQMLLDFPVLADYALLSFEHFTAFATHGHIYNCENPPKAVRGKILINGHTHIPAFCKKDGFIYLNPGSVSIPKQNSPNSFVLIDGAEVYFYNLDGEIWKKETING